MLQTGAAGEIGEREKQTNRTQPVERDHFVQFYEDDAFLADAVATFVGGALGAGDGAVLIATPEHRTAINAVLKGRGLETAGPQARGRFVVLDAGETLAQFMLDGLPDRGRFDEVIGGLMKQATAGLRRVRAFGEMVAILWAQGNRKGAMQLEDFWNELGKECGFSLLCAYPMGSFAEDADGAAFGHICGQHSHVVPAESYGGLAGHDARQLAVTVLQQKAARLEAEIQRRKQIEAALAQREEELSEFLENAMEGLHKVGPDGIILWANDAELKLLGYSREQYVGHHIAEFHMDGEVIGNMLSRLLKGEDLYDCPSRMRCRDGTIKSVLVHSNGYFRDGEFVYSRCFTRDVSPMRETERLQRDLLEKERAARAEAERISRMKDEFLATLSHELRTPLNAIFGWTQIIRQDPADAASVAEGIAVIDRNVRMQTQLIEDLLDMSRIIAGKARMEFQPTELAAVVDAAVEAVRPMAQERGVALSRTADPLAGTVSGDPVRLRQVVWNLLTNAVKFTPAGGKVEVLVERVNAQVEICVKDTGQGIRPDFLPHVFERFRQADSSTARRHGGLGLGLAIVKQIVELHGGEVRAKSAGEGKGSSFVVSLPLASAKSAESPRVSPMADGEFAFDRVNMSLKGVRILVVDDEADARDLVSRLLEDYGGEVVAAGSAEEGIGALDVFKPDVLICDIGMPGRDGYQFIRDFRERCSAEGRQVPAIALTAFARSEDRTRALRAGFRIHVSKPIEPRELVVTVCSLARRAKG